MSNAFDTLSEPLPRRLAAGLARLSIALRAGQWRLAEAHGLTPTQAQALALVASRPGLRVSSVAEQLAVTRPSASDTVAALERKGLVRRQPDRDDARASSLVATEAGAAMAREAGDWPTALLEVAGDLPDADQEALLRLVVKLIRGLQQRGAIAPARLCVTCRFFRPYAHPARATAPHHCALVDAPFGDRHLRLDCPEQDPLPQDEAEVVWTRFVSGPPAVTTP